ncbi:recombinase family protein [Nocardia sp. CA-135953]|uniref:recombinase family protein n=1 Tax=Nocardia sp. CA-135953 TaxID=3239978 RepID=UPI003D97FD82
MNLDSRVDVAGLDLAVSYLRVSSKKQMDTARDIDPDGNSIATQRIHIDRKANNLGARIVKEFLDPGISAKSIDKRREFQELIEYLREHREIKYVIVYARSRAFRNYIDAALTKRLLDKLGVKLASAREDFGDGIFAEAMEAITDVFNDMQNKMSGEDIRIKMHHKASNGGSIGPARIGYENIRIIVEGRTVNTIGLDEKRAPLIKEAFELYATGDYSTERLEAAMADRGLTTRPSPKRPVEKPVPHKTWQRILRDPYYAGWVPYKGDVYPGRHEPIVSQELFEKVQDTLDAKSGKGNRDRIHMHYLKGMLFCGRCQHAGRTSRLVFSRVTSHTGKRYDYFICRAYQDGLCDLPSLRVELVEHAITKYHRTLQLPSDFIEAVRGQLDAAIRDEQGSVRALHASLTNRLKQLDEQESNLIDLAADGSLPQGKIRAKLHQIHVDRTKAQAGLANTAEELEVGAVVLHDALELVRDPAEAYAHASTTDRRQLNQTFYERFYLDHFEVVDDKKTPLFAELHDAQQEYQQHRTTSSGVTLAGQRAGHAPHRATRGRKSGSKGAEATTAPQGHDGPIYEGSLPGGEASPATTTDTDRLSLSDLFVPSVGGLSRAVLVGAEGFEPPTAGV